ncbi:unnamed protein product, partial [Mesorhabditis spiculigera]
MGRFVTESQWVPWYRRHAPPAFCFPCLPAYMGVWKARKGILFAGVLCFCLGAMLIFASLLVCVAVECGGLGAILFPIGLLLLIVGILLIHCGWAAHLLDDQGHMPVKKTIVTTTTTYHSESDPTEDDERELGDAYKPPLPEVRQGFWQFDEEKSWQAASNPYPIQSTLKYCLDRPPY